MDHYRLDIFQEPNKDGGQTVSITGPILVVDVWYALHKIMPSYPNGY